MRVVAVTCRHLMRANAFRLSLSFLFLYFFTATAAVVCGILYCCGILATSSTLFGTCDGVQTGAVKWMCKYVLVQRCVLLDSLGGAL